MPDNTQGKNLFRLIPLTDEFMKNKKIYDIIYGYLQLHSYIDKYKRRFVYAGVIDNKYDLYRAIISKTGDSKLFCYNSFISSLNMLFEPSEKQIAEYNKALSIKDEKKRIQMLSKIPIGIIQKGKTIGIDGELEINCYFLKEVIPNKLIKTDTLDYLLTTANMNVIKIYAYLLNRYSYKKSEKGDNQFYEFSLKELAQVIGYTSKSYNKNIKMILQCLKSCGLIEYHKDMKKHPTPQTPYTFYYYLDSVSLDRNNQEQDNQEPEQSLFSIPYDPYSKFVF